MCTSAQSLGAKNVFWMNIEYWLHIGSYGGILVSNQESKNIKQNLLLTIFISTFQLNRIYF